MARRLVRPEHQGFEDLIARLERSKISRTRLGDVLHRMAIAVPNTTTQIAICRGTMLSVPGAEISQDVVSRAVRVLADPEFRLVTRLDVEITRNPGRPQQKLALGSRAWAIVGVRISSGVDGGVTVDVLVTGLDCAELMPVVSRPITTVATSAALVMGIADLIRELVADPRVANRSVLGVGVEVAGHVRDGEIIEASASPFAEPLALGADLGDELGVLAGRLARRTGFPTTPLPVIVDNDVNVLAVLETYKPRLTTRDLAVVAVLPKGVGSGLVLNGRVYRGGGGMAGEIGHVRIAPSGVGDSPACSCGQSLHVDCFATPARLMETLHVTTLDEVANERATTDDRRPTEAAEAFRLGGEALGLGIANLINFVNPSQVLLFLPPAFFVPPAERAVGSSSDSPPRVAPDRNAGVYLDAVRDAIRAHSFSDGKQTTTTLVELRPEELPFIGARAAAVRVLDSFIQHAKGQCRCTLPPSSPDRGPSLVAMERLVGPGLPS